jgi:hypothetical protein
MMAQLNAMTKWPPQEATGPGQPGVVAGGNGTCGGNGTGGGADGRAGSSGNGGPRPNGAAGTPVQRDVGDGALDRRGQAGVTVEATDMAPSDAAMSDAIFKTYQRVRTAPPSRR